MERDFDGRDKRAKYLWGPHGDSEATGNQCSWNGASGLSLAAVGRVVRQHETRHAAVRRCSTSGEYWAGLALRAFAEGGGSTVDRG